VLKLERLKKVFRASDVETTALDEVDLRIARGEFIAVMGPSGCGKSTLLNILGMLDSPTSGTYSFMDKDISRYSERERAQLRK
jgi:putative ABC transport system ATP-binding protein